MTLENKSEKVIKVLAGTFIGGRVGSWVERNRQAVKKEIKIS
jgi:hypothetical protein